MNFSALFDIGFRLVAVIPSPGKWGMISFEYVFMDKDHNRHSIDIVGPVDLIAVDEFIGRYK